MIEYEYTKNSINMFFSKIASGSFLMGNSHDNTPNGYECQHKVILTSDFLMQSSEVTVGQWRLFADETGYKSEAEKTGWSWCHIMKGWKIPGVLPDWAWSKKEGGFWAAPGFYQTEKHPVTCITWNDAVAFVNWLSEKENKKYRLPTEAEWEFCCRADTNTPYYFGEKISRKKCNYNTRKYESVKFLLSKKRTFTFSKYSPNSFGLYNMHGNVWEWCQDYGEWNDVKKELYTDTYIDNITDPLSDVGSGRILRGGSWFYHTDSCTSFHRRCLSPDISASGIGVRLALDLS